MKFKILGITLCCVLFLSSCVANSTDSNPKEEASVQSSSKVTIESLSSDDSSVVSSDKSSDTVLSDSKTSSAQSTSDVPLSDGVKKVTVTSGNALQDEYNINYTLSKTEAKQFIKLYNNLKLEYIESYGVDEHGLPIPGAGSMCPCEIGIEYSDGKETKWLNVPDFVTEQKKYKATSGAKELLEFLGNLECYKKEKINLYDMWQNGDSE